MNKRALIIGGSSGIGKATAENLLSDGLEVHVVGTNSEKLETFKSSTKGNLITHKIDITNSGEISALNNTINGWENLDYLVNACFWYFRA